MLVSVEGRLKFKVYDDWFCVFFIYNGERLYVDNDGRECGKKFRNFVFLDKFRYLIYCI